MKVFLIVFIVFSFSLSEASRGESGCKAVRGEFKNIIFLAKYADDGRVKRIVDAVINSEEIRREFYTSRGLEYIPNYSEELGRSLNTLENCQVHLRGIASLLARKKSDWEKCEEIACPKAQRLRRAIIEAVKIGYAAKAPQQEPKKGARVQVCRDQAKEIRRLAREAYSKWAECHEVEINPLPAMD